MALSTAFEPGLIDALTTAVSHAAAAVLAARADDLVVRAKPDHSPVTTADERSEAVILDEVARLLPGILLVSEERTVQGMPTSVTGDYVLVDPLDGTRELLAGTDEFTINLALVAAGKPVLGIVAAPALDLVWRTAATGGAERMRLAAGAPAGVATARTAIRTRPLPAEGRVAATSRSHFDPASDAFLARFGAVSRRPMGSALKFCRVAEGAADLYPRLAPTYQWDVAAGHAIVAAAGGTVTTPGGAALTYECRTGDLLVPGFIAWGDPSAVVAA